MVPLGALNHRFNVLNVLTIATKDTTLSYRSPAVTETASHAAVSSSIAGGVGILNLSLRLELGGWLVWQKLNR